VPTQLGVALVHGYHRIDPDQVLPTVRRNIEQLIGLIARGEASFEVVVPHALALFKAKYHYFVEHIDRMDELFAGDVSSARRSRAQRPQSGGAKHRAVALRALPALHGDHHEQAGAHALRDVRDDLSRCRSTAAFACTRVSLARSTILSCCCTAWRAASRFQCARRATTSH
jgi:DNA topoisomerase-3